LVMTLAYGFILPALLDEESEGLPPAEADCVDEQALKRNAPNTVAHISLTRLRYGVIAGIR